MLQAVLLDMDGTLIDSNAFHAESWQRAFAHFGIKVDFETVLRQIGKGGDELLPVFVPKERLKEIEEPISKWRKELFEREYMQRIHPFPKARDLVERLRASGKKVALASSAKGDELEEYKKIANISDLIEEQTTSDDADKSKPHPDIFAAALQRLKVSAKDAVAIGDTPWDAEASARAGMRSIGVTSGGWKAEELREAGCVEVYRDAEDLLAQFDRSVLST